MVLPSSTAHPADGSPRPAWLSTITRAVGLADSGVLVLVANADPARLRALVLALREREPGLVACVDARSIVEAPEGACVLLRVDQSDCAWLNRVRPVFAENRWRVVLWADQPTTVALTRQAPDFFDWISHVVECPPAVPGFALRGLATAPAYPGVVWRGGDLDAALARVAGDGARYEVSARDSYEELVERARDAHWLVCRDVEDARDVARVRWALTETGRRARCILDRPRCATPGFWPVDGVCNSWQQASRDITGADEQDAALLAALLELEPGTGELARVLIRAGAQPAELIAVLGSAGEIDPGAALAERAFARGLVGSGEIARLRASPCALRGLRDAPEVAADRTQVIACVQEALAAWSEGRGHDWELDDAELALWTVQAQGPPLPQRRPPARNSVYWLEATLAPGMKELPQHAFSWAVDLAYLDVAERWAREFEIEPFTLAGLRVRQGKLHETEKFLRGALASVKTSAGTDHWGRWDCVKSLLARVLELLGKHEESRSLFHEVLTWRETAVGTEHPDYADSLSRLASALFRQGDYEKAEELVHRSLSIIENALGSAHPDYADSLSQLAKVLAYRGRYQEAEELLHRSLGVQEQALGSEHPSYADTMGQMAWVLERRGRYREAEELRRRALGIKEKALGSAHPDYADSLSQLADALCRQGRYQEAESILGRSLAIEEKALGTEHPVVSETLVILARLYLATGRSAQAWEAIDRAYNIASQSLGPEHPVMQQIEPLRRRLHDATDTDP